MNPFKKILNAIIGEPVSPVWGVMRGSRRRNKHVAVCCSTPKPGTVAVHYLYEADANECSFPRFLGRLQGEHGMSAAVIRTADIGTMSDLRLAGITPLVAERHRLPVDADLVLPPDGTLATVEPHLSLIHHTAGYVQDQEEGVAWL